MSAPTLPMSAPTMPTFTLYEGQVLRVLRRLPSASVHCVFTSPPYFWARNYGVEGQLGLEATPKEHIRTLVRIFREVRRVLRPDGVCWINYGDRYASGGNGGGGSFMEERGHRGWGSKAALKGWRSAPPGWKHKDLMLMPHRLAVALLDDGWYFRADCILEKPNGHTESATDRPHHTHEHVFMLTRSDHYYYDPEPVRRPLAPKTLTHRGGGRAGRAQSQDTTGGVASGKLGASNQTRIPNPAGGHLRSVWSVPVIHFEGGHFATFPEALPEVGILASTSEAGCCPRCGAPLRRRIEDEEPDLEWQRACGGDSRGEYRGQSHHDHSGSGAQDPSDLKRRILRGMRVRRTVGWDPGCDCPAPWAPVPCTVLDPFTGSGTTGAVALALGRSFVGIELNPAYCAMARERMEARLRGMDLREWRSGQLSLFHDQREEATA